MSENYVGYIYIRNHWSYFRKKCVKLGKTSNLLYHDNNYKTGEPEKGWYELVFEMNISKIDIIEKVLSNYFKSYNLKCNGGREFYNIKIMDEIIPYISKLNISFKILSNFDILNTMSLSKVYYSSQTHEYNPRSYQEPIIKKSILYFNDNSNGVLILPCGIGRCR